MKLMLFTGSLILSLYAPNLVKAQLCTMPSGSWLHGCHPTEVIAKLSTHDFQYRVAECVLKAKCFYGEEVMFNTYSWRTLQSPSLMNCYGYLCPTQPSCPDDPSTACVSEL